MNIFVSLDHYAGTVYSVPILSASAAVFMNGHTST
jgi:hypothetical protein